MDNRRDYTELLEVLKTTVETQIKVTVNGKIDNLTKSVDGIKDHLKKQDEILEQLKPVQEGLIWFGTTGRFIKMTAAFLVAVVSIGGSIGAIFYFFIPKGTFILQKTSLNKNDIQEVVEQELNNREFDINE